MVKFSYDKELESYLHRDLLEQTDMLYIVRLALVNNSWHLANIEVFDGEGTVGERKVKLYISFWETGFSSDFEEWLHGKGVGYEITLIKELLRTETGIETKCTLNALKLEFGRYSVGESQFSALPDYVEVYDKAPRTLYDLLRALRIVPKNSEAAQEYI